MKKIISILNLIFSILIILFFIFSLLETLEVVVLSSEIYDSIKLVFGVLILFSALMTIISNVKVKEKKEKVSIVEEMVVEEPVKEPTIAELVSEVKEEISEQTIAEEVEAVEQIVEESVQEEVVEETEPKVEEVVEEINIQELIVKELDMSNIKYEGKLMYAPMDVKEQYSLIKNHLLSYTGVTNRISGNKETFRKSGMLAQIKLVSNKLNVYLNVIPEPFISEGYKVKNVGDTKQYEETPLHIKITNEKSIKEFVDILEVMMTSKGINKKQRFKEINYVDYLYPNGETVLNGLGLSSEYLVNTINSKIIPSDLPNDLLDYSATIDGEKLSENVYKTTIYIDNLVNYYNDGDIVNKENLLQKKLIKKDDYVVIKGRGTLDRKLIIFADDFDELAVKMIYITNGTIVRIKH